MTHHLTSIQAAAKSHEFDLVRHFSKQIMFLNSLPKKLSRNTALEIKTAGTKASPLQGAAFQLPTMILPSSGPPSHLGTSVGRS